MEDHNRRSSDEDLRDFPELPGRAMAFLMLFTGALLMLVILTILSLIS